MMSKKQLIEDALENFGDISLQEYNTRGGVRQLTFAVNLYHKNNVVDVNDITEFLNPGRLFTTADIARWYGVSLRRARALAKTRHDWLGIGMLMGRQWIFHARELDALKPDPKHRFR